MVKPRKTGFYWLRTCIDKLVEKKIGSGIQINQNNFKTAVKIFKNRLKIVEAEIKKLE